MIYWWIFLFTGLQVSSKVAVYQWPPEMPVSQQYEITVQQGRNVFSVPVLVSQAQFPEKNRSKNTAFAIFSFSGRVKVTVKKLGGTFSEGVVMPASFGIKGIKTGNTLVFTLDRPGNLAIEFDKDLSYPLLLFANPLEQNPPSKADPKVRYFGPGYHDTADTIWMGVGETLYLAGGAVLSAHIMGRKAAGARIIGRGIVSGRRFGHTHGKLIHFPDQQSPNLYFEGFTMVDAPGYYLTTRSRNTHAVNVKGLGWWFNTDGFSFGPDGLAEDCFLKCNDDAIKLYHSGNRVYRTTIWQMENGAPFQISWNMNSDNSRFVVKDCDVIHCDHEWDNPNEAVFAAIHGGSGHMCDYLFEDIRIENAGWKLFSLQVMPNRFAKADTLGKITRVTFRNISLMTPDGKPMRRKSVLKGFDRSSCIRDIHIEGVKLNGRPFTYADMQMDSTTVFDVRVKP